MAETILCCFRRANVDGIHEVGFSGRELFSDSFVTLLQGHLNSYEATLFLNTLPCYQLHLFLGSQQIFDKLVPLISKLVQFALDPIPPLCKYLAHAIVHYSEGNDKSEALRQVKAYQGSSLPTLVDLLLHPNNIYITNSGPYTEFLIAYLSLFSPTQGRNYIDSGGLNVLIKCLAETDSKLDSDCFKAGIICLNMAVSVNYSNFVQGGVPELFAKILRKCAQTKYIPVKSA